MHWEKLLSKKRFEAQTKTHETDESVRGEFQRDYDRIVFSSAFRRLQNKTQVMPMPESDFVHTRLTHSLEASCVGRSLGRIVGKSIVERHPELTQQKNISDTDFGDAVAAACLAHDIGNPPFGHSGEDAISAYFQSPEAALFLRNLTEAEKADLQRFEGNAAGFRILTHTYPAQCDMDGGLRLTYTTLATFTKYPKESVPHFPGSKLCSEKKYGFFQSEKARFNTIASELGLLRKSSESSIFFNRHPLAFLVEAADDICYRVVDFEDGCKLGLIPAAEGVELLRKLRFELDGKTSTITFTDWREEIGYLRARIIGELIEACAKIFLKEEEGILAGTFDKALISELSCKSTLDEIKKLSIQKIYKNRPVLEIEAAGFEVLGGLLDAFLKAVFQPNEKRHQKHLDLIPDQFIGLDRKISSSDYEKIMNITDYISGLTDQAAIALFRKIKGISLPKMY